MQLTVLNTQHSTSAPVRRERLEREVDARGLAADLEGRIEGEVRFDRTSRALYATDASNYRHVPIGVVAPRSAEDVVEVMRVCREHGAPVVSRGAGTGLSGQTTNFAVVIDYHKYMDRVLEVDPERKIARVQPGVRLDQLNGPALEEHRMRLAPDPATHPYCTIGGMVGNNACGVHSIMEPPGRTSDFTEALEVVTYGGERMRVGATGEEEFEEIVRRGGRCGEIYRGLREIVERHADLIREKYGGTLERRGSGYLLDQLLPENGFQVARSLVGTEGTCVAVTEATLRMIDWPHDTTLVVLGYPDVHAAADDIMRVREYGPMGLEGMDDRLVRFMQHKDIHLNELGLLPEGNGWLIAEFGGRTQDESDERARAFVDAMSKRKDAPTAKVYGLREETEKLWKIRESGLSATAFAPLMKDTWPGWEDSAVPPEKFGDYLRELRKLLDRHGYECSLYGHFGQGLVHCRIDFDLVTHEGLAAMRRFREEAGDLVTKYGGSFSGEHGDGQAKAGMLEKMYGPELVGAFRRFKSLWDPDGKMNPGMVIDAYPVTEDLRLGENYAPWEPTTHFQFPDDGGSWHRATLRCVGVGKCLRTDDAFMCPSYQVTMEEKHTTRGRAHALWEMTRGSFVHDGWKSDEVMETLDLCLSCKGCKNECPVNVDIATYKAEFLSHYWEGRLRPRTHWSMGLIGLWARLAELAPGLANFAGQTWPLSGLAKAAAGVSQERTLPEFAAEPFTAWFRKRWAQPGARGVVLLWPDVFTDRFHPSALRAMTEVLERLGYTVRVPEGRAPVVRPLIHYGMLKAAKRELRRAVRMMAPYARSGVPVVFAEPSEASVYRDELHGLMPQDQDGQRIRKKALTFGEFLAGEGVELPRLRRRAILHGHCHEKAVLQFESTRKVLGRMGVEIEEPEPGCCGMAGSFGFEAEHYGVSQQIGELHLLPAVREADDETLVIADGFSCRAQIAEGAERVPMHLAEVVLMAMELGPTGVTRRRAEEVYAADRRPRATMAGMALVGAALAAGVLVGGRVGRALR